MSLSFFLGILGLFFGLLTLLLAAGMGLIDVYTNKIKPPPPAIKVRRDELVSKSILYKWLIVIIEIIAFFIEKRISPSKRKEYHQLLNYSGNPLSLTADEFAALRVFSAAVCSIILAWLAFSIAHSFNLPLFFVGGFIGYFYPVLWSKDKQKARTHGIDIRLPYTLDFLILSLEAGLDFISSLKEITQKNTSKDNALIEEFSRMLKEIELGKPRREALKRVSERVFSKHIESFVNTVVQAEQQGIPLKNAFKQMAGGLRIARQQAAEKTALEAPVKMLIPMMFIFLSTFLVLFGGLIVDFIKSSN